MAAMGVSPLTSINLSIAVCRQRPQSLATPSVFIISSEVLAVFEASIMSCSVIPLQMQIYIHFL